MVLTNIQMSNRLNWSTNYMLKSLRSAASEGWLYGPPPSVEVGKDNLHTIQFCHVLPPSLIPTKEGLILQRTCCVNVRQPRTVNNRPFCWHASPQRWLLVAQPVAAAGTSSGWRHCHCLLHSLLTTVILNKVQNYRYLRTVAMKGCHYGEMFKTALYRSITLQGDVLWQTQEQRSFWLRQGLIWNHKCRLRNKIF